METVTPQNLSRRLSSAATAASTLLLQPPSAHLFQQAPSGRLTTADTLVHSVRALVAPTTHITSAYGIKASSGEPVDTTRLTQPFLQNLRQCQRFPPTLSTPPKIFTWPSLATVTQEFQIFYLTNLLRRYNRPGIRQLGRVPTPPPQLKAAPLCTS